MRGSSEVHAQPRLNTLSDLRGRLLQELLQQAPQGQGGSPQNAALMPSLRAGVGCSSGSVRCISAAKRTTGVLCPAAPSGRRGPTAPSPSSPTASADSDPTARLPALQDVWVVGPRRGYSLHELRSQALGGVSGLSPSCARATLGINTRSCFGVVGGSSRGYPFHRDPLGAAASQHPWAERGRYSFWPFFRRKDAESTAGCG